jgi:hypothetical protein
MIGHNIIVHTKILHFVNAVLLYFVNNLIFNPENPSLFFCCMLPWLGKKDAPVGCSESKPCNAELHYFNPDPAPTRLQQNLLPLLFMIVIA